MMWKPPLLLFALLLSVFVVPVELSGQVESESFINAGTSFDFASATMGSIRQVNVRVPAGYHSSEQSYNVLYVVDGGIDQDFLHIAGLAQLSSVNLDYEELIVVGIGTVDRLMELTHEPEDPRYIEDPPRAGRSQQFHDHIVGEVVPFIESRFRTGDRKALVGESLAGLFVMEVFLTNPDSFTDYISVSPSLWWDDRALARRAGELLSVHDDSARRLYLTMADEGGTMRDGLERVLAAVGSKGPAGLEFHFVDRKESHTHATIYHPAVHDALNRLFDTPHPEPAGELPWYLIDGGQPPEGDR